MRMYDIILKKRNGANLSTEEINFFISEYTSGTIPDYQASALMMAIFFNGMSDRETTDLTKAMAHSGSTVDLSMFGHLSVDKHSTGGVGDKTSLIVAPIVASLGGKVAKMSGRGLGHTGGTVDKLESIPGYRTSLSIDELLYQIDKIGIAVIGQTGNLAPVDKKLYALRDVTATIDSIPLITSSIMSKKIAAGSQSIVLDVKYGSGAFMKTKEDAQILATKMVEIGQLCNRKTVALLTNMDSPLGFAIGNSLEVIEAVEVLKYNKKGALRDICVSLASNMISLVFNITQDEAKQKVELSLSTGKAFEKMREWISFQGGDLSYVDNTSLFQKPKYNVDVLCDETGYISALDAQKIGEMCVMLGAGRISKNDTIDHSAGILLAKTIGDTVCKGDKLCTFFSNDLSAIDHAKKLFKTAVCVSETAPKLEPLIYKVIR